MDIPALLKAVDEHITQAEEGIKKLQGLEALAEQVKPLVARQAACIVRIEIAREQILKILGSLLLVIREESRYVIESGQRKSIIVFAQPGENDLPAFRIPSLNAECNPFVVVKKIGPQEVDELIEKMQADINENLFNSLKAQTEDVNKFCKMAAEVTELMNAVQQAKGSTAKNVQA